MLDNLVSFPSDHRIQITSMIKDIGTIWERTGSARFFGKGHDLDVVVLLKPEILTVEAAMLLMKSGWTVWYNYHGSEFEIPATCDVDTLEEEPWFPAKKGDWNLLIYREQEHYDLMIKATDLCCELALIGTLKPDDKAGRITIFKSIVGV